MIRQIFAVLVACWLCESALAAPTEGTAVDSEEAQVFVIGTRYHFKNAYGCDTFDQLHLYVTRIQVAGPEAAQLLFDSYAGDKNPYGKPVCGLVTEPVVFTQVRANYVVNEQDIFVVEGQIDDGPPIFVLVDRPVVSMHFFLFTIPQQ